MMAEKTIICGDKGSRCGRSAWGGDVFSPVLCAVAIPDSSPSRILQHLQKDQRLVRAAEM